MAANLDVHKHFREVFLSGDVQKCYELFAEDIQFTTPHPGLDVIVGRDNVRQRLHKYQPLLDLVGKYEIPTQLNESKTISRLDFVINGNTLSCNEEMVCDEN
eukprot:Pgem_evm1s2702